jgi:OOP family OmpA-OmpF porin
MKILLRLSSPLFLALGLVHGFALAQAAATSALVVPGRVVITGAVPDEATRAALMTRLQELYGTGQVIDQLTVGGVVAPPNWSASVQKLVNQNLKSISKGQLVAEGTTVTVRGEVNSDNVRQAIANSYADTLGNAYVVKNALRVTASGQTMLDRTLANRTIEFENGSAMLTEDGKKILDEMADTLKRVAAKQIEVIGHTDNSGEPSRNLALSRSRADAVKVYLTAKGLAPGQITTSGMGADQPLVANTSEENRRRNRRIEFRISQ